VTRQINPYKTHWYNRRLPYMFHKHRVGRPGFRATPEMVRLDADPTVEALNKPPVRIFIGSEPSQYRAERVLVWSVVKQRNPARAYEIYLMKDLAGFDRVRWKTGFTNYRYAIPELAGGQGRAIYNDVDQLYLADPAELFDMDMNGGGVCCITETENAVMLIDCAKMIDIWRPRETRTPENRHAHFMGRVHDKGLWRQMPGPWNSRDGEYPIPETKCLHYTTLHTQPWQPFPDRFRYRPSPLGDVFHDLEREADAAGFLLFGKSHPSRRFGELTTGGGDAGGQHFNGLGLKKSIAYVAGLIKETGATTVLDYGAGKARSYDRIAGEPEASRIRQHADWPGVRVVCYDPGYAPFAEPYDGGCDGVISTDVVEHIPHEDIPWVLDEMFGQARLFVFVVAACYPAKKFLPNGENAHCAVERPDWWRVQMEMTARRYPGIRWMLVCDLKSRFSRRRRFYEGVGGGDCDATASRRATRLAG